MKNDNGKSFENYWSLFTDMYTSLASKHNNNNTITQLMNGCISTTFLNPINHIFEAIS